MSYSIQDFIRLIARLRNPNGGCPWDLKQNYTSMIPCLIEETYEVIEAIQKKDMVNLREELGDLLLQVVFFSQLASEDHYFTFDDVLNDVAQKIVRRHPHVFGDLNAGNEEEALARWNEIKAQEKSGKVVNSILDSIPHAFPALLRAQKLQKQMEKGQAELAATEFVGKSAQSLVVATLTGDKKVVKIDFQEAVVDPEDLETLSDMTTQAINAALAEIDAATKKKLGAFAGKMPF